MKKRIALILAVALICALSAQASELKDKDLKVLDQAPGVLESLTSAPDKGIPRNLLERAECIVVFPNVTKGAFIVGGEHGRGVATCRNDGKMGAPAFFQIGGASIGWQFGGEQTDFVMLVMNRDGMKHLLKDQFKIGAEASAAIGPVGRTAEASTDILLRAQILSWSRSQGLFAGASLDGAAVTPDKDANARLYGRAITAQEILEGDRAVVAAARRFVDATNALAAGSDVSSAAHGNAMDDQEVGLVETPRTTTTTPSYTTTTQQMPATASNRTLYILGGLIALGGALGIRLWTRR